MAIGPIQLIVLGFTHPDFRGEVIAELEKLRKTDSIRVIDALAVHKGPQGNIAVERLSTLSPAEAVELGGKIGTLIGLGAAGEAGAEAGAAAKKGGVHPFDDADAWDVLADIPNDSAAALLLIEHHWAVPLRDAVARARGFRISDGFISPFDLIEIGLVNAEEARQPHDLETAGSTPVVADADLTAITIAEVPTGRDQVIGGIAAVPDAAGELWLTGRHYHHRYRIGLQSR